MGTRTSYTPGTFCWTDLSTTDTAGAKAFYSGLFGWEIADMPVGDDFVYTMLRRGEHDVAALSELMPDQREQGIPPHWMNYVQTEDVDAVAARVPELGGNVLAEPFDVLDAGRMVVLADPAGAVIAAWQPGRHIGAGLVNEPGAMTWNDLQTPDVDTARGFYSELFGWAVEEVEGSDGRYFTITNAGATNGGMMPLPMEGIPPHWQPYFAAEDLETARGRVEELGGQILAGPMEVPGGAFVAVRDPQGAVFSLFAGELDP